MDSKDDLHKTLSVGDYRCYFQANGSIGLITTRYNEFLDETQMFNYLLVSPEVFDTLAETKRERLIDLNSTMGAHIRQSFGLYFPDNPHVDLISPISNPQSPEMLSYRLIMTLWYNINSASLMDADNVDCG